MEKIKLLQGLEKSEKVNLKLAITGAPGSGKSTLASGLHYFSKLLEFRVDWVPEVAKWHVYRGTDFTQNDFEYKRFDEQKELEDIFPPELEITICEAPLITGAVFTRFYRGEEDKVTQDMLRLAQEHKNRYTHYFVTQKLKSFEEFGRNENEEQSNKLHEVLVQTLKDLEVDYTLINSYDDHVPINILKQIGAARPKH